MREDGEFDTEAFKAACRTMITAQEILVDNASYPTPAIDRNSHDYRPLGLGYANLGVLLMDRGLPYDSDGGRAYAAAVTALMHGEAYAQSARIAAAMGALRRLREERGAHAARHRQAPAARAHDRLHAGAARAAARRRSTVWDEAYTLGVQHGYRNSQVTVLAPTGTIGFMMDCDTTGIEPDIALVKYKKLVGGGVMKIVNQSVPGVLQQARLRAPARSRTSSSYIDEKETIEGAPHLKDEHLAVFDCAFPPANGKRSIHYMGHIKMMAAVQPFLSGAISKTVNMPTDATPGRDRERLPRVVAAGPQGGGGLPRRLQAQPAAQHVEGRAEDGGAVDGGAPRLEARPARRKLPDERRAITHKFSIAGHEGYITVGMYEDGKPGEIFLVMAKEGSTISGLMDAFATSISMALQYGVPLEALVEKFSHVRFEPSGFTKNPEIPYAKSITDYIFRWLASKFLCAEHAGRRWACSRSRPRCGREPAAGGPDGGSRRRAPRERRSPSAARPTRRPATTAAAS